MQAQEDAPWWKKLFKQETVDEQDQQEPRTEERPVNTPDSLATTQRKEVFTDTTHTPILPGTIRIEEPNGFERLDSLFMASPPKRQGYRLQIFFGPLQSAREARSTFIAERKDFPCYLVQNPPNFAVQIGDFRNQLEAHRLLEELKGKYPGAIVVPAEIENPGVKKQS